MKLNSPGRVVCSSNTMAALYDVEYAYLACLWSTTPPLVENSIFDVGIVFPKSFHPVIVLYSEESSKSHPDPSPSCEALVYQYV